MKFLLLSDIHGTDKIPVGRLDNVFETFDRKFTFILEYAYKHDCAILQAGDLSDSSRNWNILDYYMSKLREYEVPFYTVFGQHDMYLRSKPESTPSNMLALIRAGLITPLSYEPEMVDGIAVYGANWKEEIPEGPRATTSILVLHAPVSKTGLWYDHDFTDPNYFLSKHKNHNVVLVGDIHKRFKIRTNNRYILNTGPLLRLEANQYNHIHRPCFYVLDTESWRVHTVLVPCEPADKVLTREHIEEKNITAEELEQFASKLRGMKPLPNLRRKKVKQYLRRKVKDKRVANIIMEIIDVDRPKNTRPQR